MIVSCFITALIRFETVRVTLQPRDRTGICHDRCLLWRQLVCPPSGDPAWGWRCATASILDRSRCGSARPVGPASVRHRACCRRPASRGSPLRSRVRPIGGEVEGERHRLDVTVAKSGRMCCAYVTSCSTGTFFLHRAAYDARHRCEGGARRGGVRGGMGSRRGNDSRGERRVRGACLTLSHCRGPQNGASSQSTRSRLASVKRASLGSDMWPTPLRGAIAMSFAAGSELAWMYVSTSRSM